MVHVMLFTMLNILLVTLILPKVMCAVPNLFVFCSFLISCFPVMLFRYFLNDFEVLPVSHIIIGITFVFTLHMSCVSILISFNFRILSASFYITLFLLTLQHLLTSSFLFNYHRVSCPTCWTNRVRNEEVLHRVKEE